MNPLPQKNIDLHLTSVKNRILQYLYSMVNVASKQETITCLDDINAIRDNDYIICPRFQGIRSWIIFCKFNDVYYAVNFPKHGQHKKEKIIIHPVNIQVTGDFYHGTVMEGIYYRMDNARYLVIDEVYLLCGQNQLLKPKEDRLNVLSQHITNRNIIMSTSYYIFVSQYFQINKKNLTELYEKIKNDNKIQELIFYPKNYGKKIFRYTITDVDVIDDVIKLAQFRLQKTKNPDVYNVISLSTGEKIDIAYIPDMESSKRCKQWFKDYKKKELLVKCQMDPLNKRWIPVEVVENDIDDISEDDDNDGEIAEV